MSHLSAWDDCVIILCLPLSIEISVEQNPPQLCREAVNEEQFRVINFPSRQMRRLPIGSRFINFFPITISHPSHPLDLFEALTTLTA
jgi:hypothetical protein